MNLKFWLKRRQGFSCMSMMLSALEGYAYRECFVRELKLSIVTIIQWFQEKLSKCLKNRKLNIHQFRPLDIQRSSSEGDKLSL